MDSKYPTRSCHAELAFLLITCFFIPVLAVKGEAAESRIPIIDAVKTLFSLPTTYDCWILKVKALFFQRGRPYFPPSDLDSGEEGMMGSQGMTDKVKEAAVKCLDKSKSTVEDSARSAAKLAEEAVDKSVKKLRKTLLGRTDREDIIAAHQEAEL